MEEITLDQAQNLSRVEKKKDGGLTSSLTGLLRSKRDYEEDDEVGKGEAETEGWSGENLEEEAAADADRPGPRFQVEVDPLQSVDIDRDRIFIFRRIIIDNEVYRQGFVIQTRPFLEHMADAYFRGQPLAKFTGLKLEVVSGDESLASTSAGTWTDKPVFALSRTFPRPFSFLRADLACARVPPSPGRRTITFMVLALAAVMLTGFLAIYHSARLVVDLSQRRAGFVSSVTHELKTPLTNIRMYIEMLEEGIAGDPEREQEYYRILNAETGRLSRLINNVLEFSKLEKKQRSFDPIKGDLSEVLAEILALMGEKVRQEGFVLKVENLGAREFLYDREVMIQVLMNLIDNSLKFGRAAQNKEITVKVETSGNRARVSVSDAGPGLAPGSLKKVFDDFYREDNSLTRSAKGTGIGLALVRKFAQALGGRVFAANNRGPGCTITIELPLA